MGASDWGPCPGLAGWSQRSPRVPAEGSEFLLLVCCPGDWKPHHHMLRAGPHPSNPLCQTSLGHCSARDWVSGKARESGHPKNHLTPSRGASPLGNTAPWWALRPHFLDCQIPPPGWPACRGACIVVPPVWGAEYPHPEVDFSPSSPWGAAEAVRGEGLSGVPSWHRQGARRAGRLRA